jgi:hypothetical protein
VGDVVPVREGVIVSDEVELVVDEPVSVAYAVAPIDFVVDAVIMPEGVPVPVLVKVVVTVPVPV